MALNIKLKKGFEINLKGKAKKTIGNISQPKTFAIKPTDFVGISQTKLKVKVGENVKAGSPIMYDKAFANILYTAPVSGEIAEIIRGAKRKILEIRILADKNIIYENFTKYSEGDLVNISKEDAIDQMTKSGVWSNIIQRPFGVVANPVDSPKSIFISAFDTHPLAPDMEYILDKQEKYFQAGLYILTKFTEGIVHVNVNNDSADIFKNVNSTSNGIKNRKTFSNGFLKYIGLDDKSKHPNVQVNTINGIHPAGNVGVQIHHIDAINKGEIIWTVHPYGVTQIGKLFLKGIYDASKLISLTGSEVENPQYYKTYSGTAINTLLDGNLKSDHVRFISGNPLTGDQITSSGYLGFYHNQITVIPEGDYYEMLGWILPTTNKLSFHRAFGLLSFMNGQKEYAINTNTKGQKRAFVQTGAFEKITPMDILPTYLLKAILAEDFDDMEGLGIYEVIEEDLALCEFIDLSKQNIQRILREGLDLIKNS